MAEAIAVVGLVSSIISLIDLTIKVVTRIHDFAGQASDIPQTFRSLANRLPLLSKTLEQIRDGAQTGNITDGVVTELDRFTKDITDRVKALQQCLDRVIPKTTDSQFKRARKSLKSVTTDDKVRKIAEQVHQSIDILTLYQSTHSVSLDNRILKELAQLQLTSNSLPLQQTFGLCFGLAPLIEPAAFVGRSSEIETLHKWLSPDNKPRIQKLVSIVGMGGLGKTQLSLAYARQYGHFYSSVFWVNAKDLVSLRKSMSALDAIISPQTTASPTSVGIDDEERRVERVRRWLSESWNHQWLVIFDNYDDPSLPNVRSTTGYDIRPFFPQRVQGSILITTRCPKLTFTQRLTLQKFVEIDTGVFVLSQRTGQDLANDGFARKLAVRLDGLPLALATAGTYLAETGVSCSDYLELHETAWLDLHDSDINTLLEYDSRTLSSTWTVSLEKVSRQDADAAELLKFCAFFHNDDLYYDLLRAGSENGPAWLSRVTAKKIPFDRAMAKLQTYSLVEVVGQTYQIHTCVHDWLIEHSLVPLLGSLFSTAVKCIVNSLPDDMSTISWTSIVRLGQHAKNLNDPRFQKFWETYTASETNRGDCSTFFFLCLEDTLLDVAELELSQLLPVVRDLHRPDRYTDCLILIHLGVLYSQQGDMVKAQAHFRHALSISLEVTPGTPEDVNLTIGTGLALVCLQLEGLAGAERLLNGALDTVDRSFGKDSDVSSYVMYSLGTIHILQGEYCQAAQMYRQRHQAPTSYAVKTWLTILIIHRLGPGCLGLGQFARAQRKFTKAISGYQCMLEAGATRSDATFLGIAYLYSGRLEEAEQLFASGLNNVPNNTASMTSDRLSQLLCTTLLKRMCAANMNEIQRRTLLTRLLRHVEQWGCKHLYVVGDLVRVLAREHDEQASIAYSYYVKHECDVEIEYDGCKKLIEVSTGRHICRACEDADLCDNCMSKYMLGELTLDGGCDNHGYCDVGSAAAEKLAQLSFQLETETDLQNWLTSLREKHEVKDDGVFPNPSDGS